MDLLSDWLEIQPFLPCFPVEVIDSALVCGQSRWSRHGPSVLMLMVYSALLASLPLEWNSVKKNTKDEPHLAVDVSEKV